MSHDFHIGIAVPGYDERGVSEAERAALEDDSTKAQNTPTREELDEVLAEEESAAAGERSHFVPLMEVRPVEDYDGKLGEIEDQKAAIRQQRADGDLDFDEAEAELERLNDQRAELRLQHERARQAMHYNERVGEQQWRSEVLAFMGSHAEYEDQVLWDALDSTVKRLANERDAQGSFVNADRDANWFLEEAHRRVAALAQPGHHENASVGGEDREARVDADRGSNRFAHLDGLKGLDLEAALEALSKADAEAYLRGE